jgi:nicotinamide phosphoribosyltransferase
VIKTVHGDVLAVDRGIILQRLEAKGFASANVVFGIGSYTYQYNTRDTFGFAMKATWAMIDGESHDLFKDPATDNGVKKSAKGLLRVEKEAGKFVLYDQRNEIQELGGQLEPVFTNGLLVSETTLEEIRQRVNESLLTS